MQLSLKLRLRQDDSVVYINNNNNNNNNNQPSAIDHQVQMLTKQLS